MTGSEEIVLYQFAFSHFNEKARWALDWKGLPSRRISVLPGFHARTVGRLSGGPTTTPLITDSGHAVSGSADIVSYLEEKVPERPLYPDDPEARAQVEEWIDWLDDEVGPAVRLALFHELLPDPAFSGRIFTAGQGSIKGGLYRAVFPRLVPMLCDKMNINDETAAKARRTIDASLERIDGATRESGYLVGGTFTAADLTAGCLLFPLFFPDSLEFALPDVPSQAFDHWLARWKAKPGIGYAKSMWAKHR